MKKMMSKRQIIMAALVLALGLAVYLNWSFTNAGNELSQTNLLDSGKNYGDTQYVNENKTTDIFGSEVAETALIGDNSINKDDDTESKEAGSDDQYFANARLNRTKARDEAISILKEALTNAKADSNTKAEATKAVAEITKQIEQEARIENLIKAKKFSECMVYLDGEAATVVVKANNLTASQVAQIKDIVTSQAKVSGEINIIEAK